jgi:hypothetical protein
MDCFKLKQGKSTAYKDFVTSDEARHFFDKIEKATGFKYLNTYFCIIPAVDPDYDVYEMWEFPNMAAYDKARESDVFKEYATRVGDMLDFDKPAKVLTLRTARDVKIIYEPPPKP